MRKFKTLMMPLTFVKDQENFEMRQKRGFPESDDHMCGYFVDSDGVREEVRLDAVKSPYRRMFCGTTIKMPKYGDTYNALIDLDTNEVCALSDGKRYDIVFDGYIFTGRIGDDKTFNVRRWQQKMKVVEGKEFHITSYMMTDEQRKEVEGKYSKILLKEINMWL